MVYKIYAKQRKSKDKFLLVGTTKKQSDAEDLVGDLIDEDLGSGKRYDYKIKKDKRLKPY